MFKYFIKVCILQLLIFIIFSAQVFALSVTSTDNGQALIDEILGTGITVSNIAYNGIAGSGASGIFTDGVSSGIGMASGGILTTGLATAAMGPNSSNATSHDTGTGYDADLDSLAGIFTHDATVLEFDFTFDGGFGGDLFFNFVFASEEYNEFIGSPYYNDVFAFFLDGVNIALLPDGMTPVSANNVNLSSNSQYFNNNESIKGSPPYDIEYDGFTDVFLAQALGLSDTTHHIKIAIADAYDGVVDSAVFIKGGTFSNGPPPAVPEPSTLLLFGVCILGLAGMNRKKRY